MTFYIVITSILSFLLFLMLIFDGADFHDEKLLDYYFYPKNLYKASNLNWLGVGLGFLLCLFVIPEYFIATFFYWLFHVGRKD